MPLFRYFLLIVLFTWCAPDCRAPEGTDCSGGNEHQEIVLLAVQYRQQVSERIYEAHLGVFPVADSTISLLSQPEGMHACAAIRLPIRQSNPSFIDMSMQC